MEDVNIDKIIIICLLNLTLKSKYDLGMLIIHCRIKMTRQ